MKNKIDALKADVEIPEVVQKAAKETFAKILAENHEQKEVVRVMSETDRKKKKGKKKWIALVAVAALAVGALSVSAGTNFAWFSSVEEEMFISEAKKDAMEKYGLGIALDEAVTQNGVTVTVEQAISDSKYFFVVLGIEGMDYSTGDQWLTFEEWNIDIVGGNIHENMGGQYLGVDKDSGKMLYLFEGYNRGVDLVGSTMNMSLTDITNNRRLTEEEMAEKPEGSFGNEVIEKVEGTWEFSFVLNGGGQELSYELNAQTGNPDITLSNVTITPLSIEMSTVHADPEQMLKDWDDPNGKDYNTGFYGFLMKDGSIVDAGAGAGGGNFNKSRTGRDEFSGFGTIVDLYEIEAILFHEVTDQPWSLSHPDPTVEDFIVVTLPAEK